MATLILRPASDSSLDHICSSGFSGYNLINESTSDNDSTYIYQTISSTSNSTINSTFGLSKSSLSNIKITSVKIVMVAKDSDSDITSSASVVLKQNNTTIATASASSLGTSYSTYTGTGNLSSLDNLTVTITSSGYKSSSKDDNGYIRITQVYVEIIYEETQAGTGLYMKSNGSYAEVQKVYKRINGVYVKQTDISSLFSTSAKYKKGN